MRVTRQHQIALTGALLCAAALAAAILSERFLGLIPCALCLAERWPYRAGILVGLAGAVLPDRMARVAIYLLFGTLLWAAGAAFVHVGVEQHWWPSPFPECTAPDLPGLSPAERFARMPLTPSKSCEEPDYLIQGVPVTMPQMNLLYTLATLGGLAIWLGARRRAVA